MAHSLRVGIFGGSFDPVHKGHDLLATTCREQAQLDSVWFVPAAQQPLKPEGPVADSADRLAMLRLIIDGESDLEVSTIELERGGTSYTIDTLEQIHVDHPQAELFLLIGGDSLERLAQWHRAADVCRLATPLVVHRAGGARPPIDDLAPLIDDERLSLIRDNQVDMPATPISSTRVRQLIADQGDWDRLVLPDVARYIRRHNLYVNEPTTSDDLA